MRDKYSLCHFTSHRAPLVDMPISTNVRVRTDNEQYRYTGWVAESDYLLMTQREDQTVSIHAQDRRFDNVFVKYYMNIQIFP